jgi:hypothetical protein
MSRPQREERVSTLARFCHLGDLERIAEAYRRWLGEHEALLDEAL